jgi:predicted MFS family arabinose efflux permease
VAEIDEKFGSVDIVRETGSQAQALSVSLVWLLAFGCACAVANVYFAHPLLDSIGRDFAMARGASGVVITATQVGYALGLILLVPLGDLADRRRLVTGHFLLLAVALAVVGTARSSHVLLGGFFFVGLLAVVVQALVAFAATLAEPARRGQVVGIVTSGVVVGILMARVVSGAVADFGGWRAVYLSSAAMMLILAFVLHVLMPQQAKSVATGGYFTVLRSTIGLIMREPVVRIRGVLALFIFATFNVFWAPLVFPLSQPPYSLSHGEIGFFGLAGVAGALGAARAGRLADRGFAGPTTTAALALMAVSWLPIMLLQTSLWPLIIGVLLLDFAISAIHVTNQSVLFASVHNAQSRVVSAYMTFYAVGSATGAVMGTAVYEYAGWLGVCVLGLLLSFGALTFWLSVSPKRGRARP